jgi:hypothetical protein
VLVFFAFPKKEEEQELLARYHAEDQGPRAEAPEGPLAQPATP